MLSIRLSANFIATQVGVALMLDATACATSSSEPACESPLPRDSDTLPWLSVLRQCCVESSPDSAVASKRAGLDKSQLLQFCSAFVGCARRTSHSMAFSLRS